MAALPASDLSLLVRTDFDDDAAWERVVAEAQAEHDDGFQANVQPVDDRAFQGATWQDLGQQVQQHDEGALVHFVVDRMTLASPDHPILVIDIDEDEDHEPFRCVAAELWSVENNLNLANMDWEDFAESVDDDGVFRGFDD